MSIKEFSQKNSVTFFYATIVLAILLIVFGAIALCNNNQKFQRNGNFDRQNMMQQNGNRNFPQNRKNSNFGNSQLPDSQTTQTEIETTTPEVIQ